MSSPRVISPVDHLEGLMHVPGSKSISNRALVCAALAGGESVIRNSSDSTDTGMMINGLNQMGVLAVHSGDHLTVHGTGGRLYAPKYPIPVGNAGTTLRFLLSVAARATGTTVFEGSSRMALRPITPLIDALGELGVQVGFQRDTSRYVVTGGTLRGGESRVSGEQSSQFVSSLLLASPGLDRGLLLDVPGSLPSAPYVTMTIRVMSSFGAGVRVRESQFEVPAGTGYHAAAYQVEADASSATYPFAAAALCGGPVAVPHLAADSLQGDAGFLDVLARMGCQVHREGERVAVVRREALRGIDVDMNAMPDAVPALVAAALFAESPTRIRNVAHLRFKESDRLGTLAEELAQIGADVRVTEDGLDIHPVPLHGAQLDPHEDHRLAMMFALIGLRVPGIAVETPDCVAKSYPRFWDELARLSTHQPST
ncbi:MAG TPA: 3-phosphoshikimate 1-carboxyvinyltransferase [Bacteroidota bacterium]|nr:3-phosphoshikimate 1-carboxyvinyltransferase [Bacteroidota bacterium]